MKRVMSVGELNHLSVLAITRLDELASESIESRENLRGDREQLRTMCTRSHPLQGMTGKVRLTKKHSDLIHKYQPEFDWLKAMKDADKSKRST